MLKLVEQHARRLVDLSRFDLPERYRLVINDESLQRMYKQRFDLPPECRVVKRTHSVCPKCMKVVESVVYEHDGSIWMKKCCSEHGYFLDLYWGDAEMYYYWIQWDRAEYIGRGPTNPNVSMDYAKSMRLCPFSCGLCPLHRSNTILSIIDVTNRCNMRCSICFASASEPGPKYVYEPSLSEIERMMRVLRSERIWAPNALQLSGGEPTLRNDLPEIVRMAKRYGFDHVEVNTNGIRLAHDLDFYKALMEAGMSTIYLQFDTVNPLNDLIRRYRRYDTKAYVAVRMKVIENARKLGHRSVVPVVTVIRGYNDKDLGKIVEFGVENRDVIRWINFQPIAFAGAARLYSYDELRAMRITVPDVIIEIERQTNGMISRWDWRPVCWPVPFARALEIVSGKEKPLFTNNPVCGASTFIFYDPDERRPIPITRIVDVDAVESLMREVIKLASRGWIWRTIAKLKMLKLVRYVRHKLLRDLLKEVIVRRDYSSLRDLMFNLVGLGIMHFMDVMNYDIERVRRCTIHYATPDGRIVPFCTYNNFHRPKVERAFSVPADEWIARTGRSLSGYA